MTWGMVAMAGGTLVGSVISSGASKDAARVQQEASSEGVAEQKRQFDITQKSFQPFQEAGVSALEQQQALLGLGGTAAQKQAFTGLVASPGQKFLQERGQKTLLRNAAAIGGLGGGNVREALVQQGIGFAQQDLQNQFGRLGQLAGQGQAAATSVGQFGALTAGNIGNALQSSGQARASGILGQNQAFQQGLGDLFTIAGQSGLFSGSSS